jgi:L-lysine exporter family protein LysE/ArgO
MPTFISGFSLGLSLILAIGAQNAFVLKQGLKKQHVFLVCFICALSDALLIALGVSGFGLIVKQFPSIEMVARYAGALFLSIYALNSFISSFFKNHSLNPSEEASGSALNAALICLAFTWLNPHVYLDTVFLLGAISTKYEASKLEFAAGAMTASFIFFFSLGYGAKLLRPLFEKPRAWKILDFLIGIIMLSIAISLLANNS